MIIHESVIVKDLQVEETLIPLIEAATGRVGPDALEHFVFACVENFLDPQPILDAIYAAKKAQPGH